MKLVFDRPELVAQWVYSQLGTSIPAAYAAFGATRDGVNLCAGAVFTDYTGSNIEVTLVAPGAFNRTLIAAVCRYAFVQMRVTRLSAKTKRSNKRMRQIMPRMGWKFEGISERYFGPTRGDDAIRFVAFYDQARKWIDG